MGKPLHLEELRTLFSSDRIHIALAVITQVAVASDRSYLKCLVSLWPENREVVARMTFDMTGFRFPQVNDLVVVGIPYDDESQIIVLKQMTSKDDLIPIQAMTGDTVVVSLSGKKLWLTSDTRINLSKSEVVPTENLVLGQQLKILLSNILNQLSQQADAISTLAQEVSTHTHAGNLGYPTSPPNDPSPFTTVKSDVDSIKEEFDNYKASPVDDSVILSDIAFTEKGSE